MSINSENMLNCIVSNTTKVRKKNYQDNFDTRKQCGSNIKPKLLNISVNDLHDKAMQPVDLTTLGDPMEFISK